MTITSSLATMWKQHTMNGIRLGPRTRLRTPGLVVIILAFFFTGWFCLLGISESDQYLVQEEDDNSFDEAVASVVAMKEVSIHDPLPSDAGVDEESVIDDGKRVDHADTRQHYNKRGRRVVADEPRLAAEHLSNSVSEDENKVVIDRHFFDYLTSELHNSSYPGVHHYTQYTIARLGLKPLKHSAPLRPEFGPVINDVTSFRYPITAAPCTKDLSAPRSLFIAINTAPGYFAKRESIRKTWARHLKHQSHLIGTAGFAFILGVNNGPNATAIQKQLEQESATYGDIIQVDMMDNYYNITLKVSGLLNWIHNYCSHVDFVLKVDDDVYVNVRNLATTLQTLKPNKLNAYGVRMPFLNVVRQSVSVDAKWSIKYEMWPWINYPVFLRGASVLFAGKATTPLLAGFQTTPFIPFDDVFLTGLIASKAGVRLFDNEGMFDVQPEFPLDGCMARDSISWLTDSIAEMMSSHVATESFYSGSRRCINPSAYGTASAAAYEIADPKDVVEFPFTPIID